ncbi:MAG: hypothetical protein CMJ78_21160 [Planctomycetaceae bacterium]|nr:hypothetical protein [Planctomycetaceae bacterium]
MDSREAVLLVIAKTALSDGNVDESEREFLAEMGAAFGNSDVDGMLETAKSSELQTLVASLDSYADRFFVALRAFMMAHVDFEFDAQEEAFFEKLVDSLEITDDDLKLIESTESAFGDEQEAASPDRIIELYQQSSFCVSS